MLTNRLGLPKAIVDAVSNDPYTRGSSDISVTQLIQPPFQRKLRAENEIIEDVADRIWSLVGQVGHGIIERAYPQVYTEDAKSMGMLEVYAKYGVVAEHRLFMKIAGWTLSGQFDVIEDGCLSDYKFTSVWSVKGDTKSEWTAQLNVLRLLAIREGIDVQRLRIIAILRDWSKGKAKAPDYPTHQVCAIEIEVWPLEKTEAYVLSRVLAHQAMDPPVCSDEERWKREDVHAVMKSGRKTAVKLHEVKSTALAHAADLGAGHSVVTRPGGFARCQDYCNVSHACPAMATEVGF